MSKRPNSEKIRKCRIEWRLRFAERSHIAEIPEINRAGPKSVYRVRYRRLTWLTAEDKCPIKLAYSPGNNTTLQISIQFHRLFFLSLLFLPNFGWLANWLFFLHFVQFSWWFDYFACLSVCLSFMSLFIWFAINKRRKYEIVFQLKKPATTKKKNHSKATATNKCTQKF